MSTKYAQEVILIPKPSSDEDQSGGQVTTDAMDQFWQRRLLVDQLTTAPHGFLQHVDAVAAPKLTHLVQSFQERLHVQVIVPDQKVPEASHAFLGPGSLAEGVIFFAQLALPQP